jgi:hypothetical protein
VTLQLGKWHIFSSNISRLSNAHVWRHEVATESEGERPPWNKITTMALGRLPTCQKAERVAIIFSLSLSLRVFISFVFLRSKDADYESNIFLLRRCRWCNTCMHLDAPTASAQGIRYAHRLEVLLLSAGKPQIKIVPVGKCSARTFFHSFYFARWVELFLGGRLFFVFS